MRANEVNCGHSSLTSFSLSLSLSLSLFSIWPSPCCLGCICHHLTIAVLSLTPPMATFLSPALALSSSHSSFHFFPPSQLNKWIRDYADCGQGYSSTTFAVLSEHSHECNLPQTLPDLTRLHEWPLSARSDFYMALRHLYRSFYTGHSLFFALPPDCLTVFIFHFQSLLITVCCKLYTVLCVLCVLRFLVCSAG